MGETGSGIPGTVPDRYGDETMNWNPPDILESQGKRLKR